MVTSWHNYRPNPAIVALFPDWALDASASLGSIFSGLEIEIYIAVPGGVDTYWKTSSLSVLSHN
jgi:hypothetical protein